MLLKAKRDIIRTKKNFDFIQSPQPENERADLKPGTTVDVMSGNNFLNKPREGMIVPDAGYTYSVIENADENWVMKSVLEVKDGKFTIDGRSRAYYYEATR